MKTFFKTLFCVLVSSALLECLIVGCSPKAVSYPFIERDNTQIRNFITYSNSVRAFQYTDTGSETYALPTREWVDNKFTPYFKDFLFKYSLNSFVDIKNDCGKFTTYALTCGYILMKDEKDIGSIAMGEWVGIVGADKHSLVFFIVNDNGKPKLLFYEPQVQQFIELTENEKVCMSWRL